MEIVLNFLLNYITLAVAGIASVSYTHLDVYKRQGFQRGDGWQVIAAKDIGNR